MTPRPMKSSKNNYYLFEFLFTYLFDVLLIFSDHIDHIKNVASIDNVGLGGDYDGVPRCGAPILQL